MEPLTTYSSHFFICKLQWSNLQTTYFVDGGVNIIMVYLVQKLYNTSSDFYYLWDNIHNVSYCLSVLFANTS